MLWQYGGTQDANHGGWFFIKHFVHLSSSLRVSAQWYKICSFLFGLWNKYIKHTRGLSSFFFVVHLVARQIFLSWSFRPLWLQGMRVPIKLTVAAPCWNENQHNEFIKIWPARAKLIKKSLLFSECILPSWYHCWSPNLSCDPVSAWWKPYNRLWGGGPGMERDPGLYCPGKLTISSNWP